MYKVSIKEEAKKDIYKLPNNETLGIYKKLQLLSSNPRPVGCKKLVGSEDAYRVAKGDYRVLYTVNDRNKEIKVYKVKHRREAYRNLWF